MAKICVPPTGTIACRRLRIVDLEAVGLAGEIPQELSRCSALIHLSLHRNCLNGPIPDWLYQLPALRAA